MMNDLFKSVLEQDCCPIVICDVVHTVVYMNPAAIKRYDRYGGAALVGRSLLDCHGPASVDRIREVVAWFLESRDHNRIYTSRNDKEEKDVYMIALRDSRGQLIGYYEKHEYRQAETAPLYDFSRSLV